MSTDTSGSAPTAAPITIPTEMLKTARSVSLTGGGVLLVAASYLVYKCNVNTAAAVGADNRWAVPYWFITVVFAAAVLMALLPMVADGWLRAKLLGQLVASKKLSAKSVTELSTGLNKQGFLREAMLVDADTLAMDGNTRNIIGSMDGTAVHGDGSGVRVLVIPLR